MGNSQFLLLQGLKFIQIAIFTMHAFILSLLTEHAIYNWVILC
jgi:hypothetical protein